MRGVQKVTGNKKRSRAVSNEVRLDAKQPVPFENGGASFSFVNRSRYIPFLDSNDNFAQDLLEARLLSTTHDACIDTKKNYCAGAGFQYKDDKDMPEAFVEWCKAVNRRNDNLVKFNRRSFESHFTFGNTPIELVRFTVAGKRYFFAYVHNMMEWRLGPADGDGVISYALYSKLFNQKGHLSEDGVKTSRRVNIYSPFKSDKKNWTKDENGAERTLIWFKNDFIGFDHYGLPSAIASLIFQILEYKGARYNLDNFDNNMVVSAILALKGNLSQGEANRIGKQAIQTHTGDGKRGRVMVVASEEGIEGSDFHNFDTHKEGSYSEIDDKWTQKIIMANRWDAVLAGIQSPGSLGKGSGYLTKIIEHLLNTVIRPLQNDMMNDVWKHILKLGNEWMNWGVEIDNVVFKNNIDISGLTDVDITPAVRVNEVRQAKGLPEDPAMEGVYMKAAAAGQDKPIPHPETDSKK